jgi:hypothetical protein
MMAAGAPGRLYQAGWREGICLWDAKTAHPAPVRLLLMNISSA